MRISIPIILGIFIVVALFLVSEGHEPYSARPDVDPESEPGDDTEPMLEGQEAAATAPESKQPAEPPDETDAEIERARAEKIARVVQDLRSEDPDVVAKTWMDPTSYDAEETRALVAAIVAEWKAGVSPAWTYTAQILLWKIGEHAVVPVAEAVGHEHAYFWAANALTRIASLEGGDISSAVPTLIDHLREGSPKAQQWAAQALVHTGPARLEAVRDLTTLLESEVQQTRIEAASALAEMGPAAAIALGAIERRLETLGDGSGVEGNKFRDAYKRIRGD